jgi:type III secretion protein C
MMSLRFALRAALASLCCGALAFSPVSSAQNLGNIPFPEKTISITARGTPVGDFLKDLFGQAGLRVKVSGHPSLNDKVNGPFPGKPAVIWRQISNAYNLVAYYDGSAVRIYAAAELTNESIPTTTPAELVREVTRLGMVDRNNTVKAGKNAVSVSGVPFFIDRVKRLSSTVNAATPVVSTTPIIAGPATPPSTDIISPSLPGGGGSAAVPASAGLSSYERSTLLTAPVGARQPYEIRIFNLKYISAEDKLIKTIRGDVRVEGLETLLRNTMGFKDPDRDVVFNGNDGRSGNGVNNTPNDPDVSSRYKRDGGYSGPVIIREREPKTLDGPSINSRGKKQLVIKDRPEQMRTYAQIIDALDVEKPQIEVQVTIIEYNTDYNKSLGVSAGISIGGFNAVIGGPGSEPAGGLGQPNIGGSYTTANQDFVNLQINALERQGWLRVTSKPMSVTSDDEPLFFSNGVELPYSVAANEDAQLFSKFARLGMEVHPRIIDDGGDLRVSMDIFLVDGSIAGENSSGEIIGSTEMNTSATVRQGESMIIGGLTVDTKFDNKSKVPGLSAIPAIGELFKKRRKGSSRIEKVYIITPRIMGNGGLPKATMVQPKPQAAPTRGAAPAKKKPAKRTRG